MKIEAFPVFGLPEIQRGDDLVQLTLDHLSSAELELNDGAILVYAQKIVSKSEGRFVFLDEVTPSARARELASMTGKDSRYIEVVLSESVEVVRAVPGVLITRHKLGYVMANSGIDVSNVPKVDGRLRVLLLPCNPDQSAFQIRSEIERRLGIRLGVVISDSYGRPWRNGVVNFAVGSSGIPSIIDRRGSLDRVGGILEITQVCFADAVSSMAGILMGEGDEGAPLIVVNGMKSFICDYDEMPCGSIVRSSSEDLFK